MSKLIPTYIEQALRIEQLERELAEAQEELNDKSKFCYAVEQALDGLKGDYVEIILALRKDAERWRHFLKNPFAAWDHINEALDVNSPAYWKKQANAAIDAAMKEGGK